MAAFIITIDQGTTGSRVFLVSPRGQILGSAYREHRQIFPRPGWVEHDPEEIWNNVRELLSEALQSAGLEARQALGIGITNQRETVVVWDRKSGRSVHPAIVWQCRRTAPFMQQLKNEGRESWLQQKTGLLADPYFSASKIRYILQQLPAGSQPDLLAGTIDSWLLYQLTGELKTDYTNASRTMLFNIHSRQWDDDLLKLFGVPRALLPEVQASASLFGHTRGLDILPDGIPVLSLVGDQQGALYGQFGHDSGQAKTTYGTGAFMLMNLGQQNLGSTRGLLTTLACDAAGQPVYALEGSVFIAGAVMQWLRDSLKFFASAAESENLANLASDESEVIFVPAFAGLGAPHWQPARGAILGLTRDSGPAEITRAAIKSIALQVAELAFAMQAETGLQMPDFRVDGGATANRFLLQYQAELLQKEVIRPQNIETTVMGAAMLAAVAAGLKLSDFQDSLGASHSFFPGQMQAAQREQELARWSKAIEAVRIFGQKPQND